MKVITNGGEVIDLGATETTPTVGITDYSRRVTDDFGVTTVVKRGFARRMSVRFGVPFTETDTLQRRLAELRASPARWVADDRFDWLSARGFYKDFALDLATPPLSLCTLSVEGLAETETVPDPGGDPATDGQASTLQLLRPVVVTDAELTAGSVAEADHPEWEATTSYAVGARVIKAATHRIYESATAANLGNDPAGLSGKWLDIGPTNRWAMFDQALGTATTGAGEIAVTIDAGNVDAVALLDAVGATVRVQASDYDQTQPIGAGAITFLDLAGSSGPVTVTIAGPTQVSVGTLLVGDLVALGITEASPTAGITDYSRKAVDDFGEVTVVERAFAKRMTAKALIRTDALDIVANRIAAVRARPCLWIGQAGLDSLTVYGFFKDFSIEVGDSISKLSLSIEGLSRAAKVQPLSTSVAWPDITDPNGTKPADNATDSADLDSPFGPGTVRNALDLADLNGLNILGALAQVVNLKAALDAIETLEGQPFGAFVLAMREQLSSAVASVAADLTLIFVKNAAGTGGIINADAVQVGADTLEARSLRSVLANLDNVTANITNLLEIFYDASGLTLRSVNVMNVDGAITGTVTTLTGAIGEFVIFADKFRAVQPNGGQPIQVFGYGLDGVLEIPTARVKMLDVGVVTSANIALNGVTKRVFWIAGALGSGATVAPSGAFGEFGPAGDKAVVAVPDVPIGAETSIRMFINAQRTGGDDDRIQFRLRRTAPGGAVSYLETISVGLTSAPALIAYEWNDLGVTTAGIHSYALEANRTSGGGNYYSGKLIAEVGKR